MTLLTAINAAANGHTIVSCVGKRYTPDMLAPIWCGEHYAGYMNCGMTETERKGAWATESVNVL